MAQPYHDRGACGCCVEGVGITCGGYTSGWERGQDQRILPEYAQFGSTLSAVEPPDCSAMATSSAQVEILVGCGGCDMEIAVWVVVLNIGGGGETGLSP